METMQHSLYKHLPQVLHTLFLQIKAADKTLNKSTAKSIAGQIQCKPSRAVQQGLLVMPAYVAICAHHKPPLETLFMYTLECPQAAIGFICILQSQPEACHTGWLRVQECTVLVRQYLTTNTGLLSTQI